jgi:hypothetical protein
MRDTLTQHAAGAVGMPLRDTLTQHTGGAGIPGKDTLTQQITAGAGIPDWGSRITILVIIVFALAVTTLLLYFKMKEADQRIGED